MVETKKMGRPLKEQAGEVKKLLARHAENYEKRMGERLTFNFGRDGRLAKAQIATRGIDRCLELSDKFFQLDARRDEFWAGAFTFPDFNKSVPELVKRFPARVEGKYGHLAE